MNVRISEAEQLDVVSGLGPVLKLRSWLFWEKNPFHQIQDVWNSQLSLKLKGCYPAKDMMDMGLAPIQPGRRLQVMIYIIEQKQEPCENLMFATDSTL